MLRICFLLALCAFFVAVAVKAPDLMYLFPAACFVLLALSDAYYLGKGQPLKESELPKVGHHVVYEVCRNGHTAVAILSKKGKLLICISNGVEFTQFKLWGDKDHHRLLTPVSKKTS